MQAIRDMYNKAYNLLCEQAGLDEPTPLSFTPLHRQRYDERRSRATAYLRSRGIHALHDDFQRTLASDTNITVVWAKEGFQVNAKRVFWHTFPGPRKGAKK